MIESTQAVIDPPAANENRDNDDNNVSITQPTQPQTTNSVPAEDIAELTPMAEECDDEPSSEAELEEKGWEKDVENLPAQRERKAVDTLVPEEQKNEVWTPPKGDGEEIGSMETVMENLRAEKLDKGQLKNVHTLMYKRAGKKNQLRKNIALFTGFDVSEKERFTNKCMSLDLKIIKHIMDLFDIDRSSKTGGVKKDELIQRMFTWFQCPKEELTAHYGKKKRKKAPAQTKKRKPSKKAKVDNASDDESDDGSGTPSNSELKKWMDMYIQCVNLDETTVGMFVTAASSKFGVDLSEKKPLLKQLLADAL